MSTAISDVRDREPRDDPRLTGDVELVAPEPAGPPADGFTAAPRPVVVRRNAGLSALVGAAASAVAIAYLWRAAQSADVLDWVLCAGMAVIAVVHLASLVDARTPLLVADDLGVRVRLGHQWRGLPWDAVREVVVQPRRGPLRDGRLAVVPNSAAEALEGLDARGRRTATANTKAYGVALAVPLGLTTRASARGAALVDTLAVLGRGEVDVSLRPSASEVTVPDPGQPEQPADVPDAERLHAAEVHADPSPPADLDVGVEASEQAPALSPRRLGRLGTAVSRVARGRDRDVDAERADGTSDDADAAVLPWGDPDGAGGDGVAAPGGTDVHGDDAALPVQRSRRRGGSTVAPLRETRLGVRADVEPEGSVTLLGGAAASTDPPQWRTPPVVLSEPVQAPVLHDGVQPAADPVIGPELAAARHRVGLSVDELAERTRIRPHVIESIEVDDFAPCGGDFYARGHLRTLARVLGRDPAPLLQQFDARYASAPVDARRVFEAELATGMTGSMRSTVGGPDWALLVGVVLVLVLTWGVVRLFASEPTDVLAPPVLDGSASALAAEPSPPGGSGEGTKGAAALPPAGAKPVEVTLVAALDGSRVVVRDRSGEVAWRGVLARGTERTLQVVPPVRVRAAVGGVVAVSLNGTDRGLVGDAGGPAVRTLHRFVR